MFDALTRKSTAAERESQQRFDEEDRTDHDVLRNAQKIVAQLGKVDDQELTDLSVHSTLCGFRAEAQGNLLLEMYRAIIRVGRQGRLRAHQMDVVVGEVKQLKSLTLVMVIALFVLGIIELFGKDKGLEIILKLAGKLI